MPRWLWAIALVAFVLHTLTAPPASGSSTITHERLPLNCTVIIYGVPTCPHCRATHAALKKLGLNVTFIDVTSVGRDAFVQMVRRYLLRLTNNVGVPLTYVKCGNYTALVEGELIAPGYTPSEEYKLWARLLEALMRGELTSLLNTTTRFKSVICLSTPTCKSVATLLREALVKRNMTRTAAKLGCLAGLALCLATNETIKPVLPSTLVSKKATSHVTGRGSVVGRTGTTGNTSARFLQTIPVLIGLALLDAINPCFLTLYALTIATIASLRGRLAALKTGAGVALGVFTGYYLLGLGLVEAAASIPWVRYLLAAAVVVLGVVLVLKRIGVLRLKEEECLVCRLARRLGIGGASMTPLLGYLFGLAASLTLLPCSAGPYVVASLYLANYPLFLRIAGLLVYNLVFIAPIIAMALAASFVAAYETVRRFLEPLTGPLLIILGLYILLEPRIELLLGLAAGH